MSNVMVMRNLRGTTKKIFSLGPDVGNSPNLKMLTKNSPEINEGTSSNSALVRFNPVWNRKTVSGTYTPTDYDYQMDLNTSGGTFDIPLPTAVGRNGQQLLFRLTGSNPATITPSGTETVNGVTGALIIGVKYALLGFESDNANWLLF